MKRLGGVDSGRVLTHMLQRTDEKHHARYGEILSHLRKSSVEDILKTALTSRTKSLLEVIRSESIGLDEYFNHISFS